MIERRLQIFPLFVLLLFCSASHAFGAAMPGEVSDPEAIDSTEIRRVSFAARADGAGVVIRLHAKSPVNAYSEPRVADSNHIELVVFNAQLADAYQPDTPFDPVREFTVEPRNGHLVFLFALDKEITVQTAAYPDQASNDLLVGITLLEDSRAAALADGGETLPEAKPTPSASDEAEAAEQVENADGTEAKTDSPAEEKLEKVDPEATQADTFPIQQVSAKAPADPVSLTNAALGSDIAERWTLDTIVIDAGHGGHDPGASYFGVKEKDINLAVALKLGYYLERFLKVNVVFTRTHDVFVDLQDRGHIANQQGGKLFVSIHSNSAPYSSSVRGTETYILGLHRSEKAREVMERENSVVQLEANPDKYDDFYQNNILRTLALSANLKMSERLAASIENQFEERARRNSRGVKQAGLIVLWAASMPAVLVELGYLTNRFEAAYLNSEQGQDYLASAIFRAVRDFKLEYEKGLEAQNQRVSILESGN
jgi:N-acetylmuramoyl-L-alanine amidase